MEGTTKAGTRSSKSLGWAPLAVAGGPLAFLGLLAAMFAFRDLGLPDPVTPEPSAIVGTWTNPDGARLLFREDGTYYASGMTFLSDGTPGSSDYDLLPVDGDGTWAVVPWDEKSGSGGGITLTSGETTVFLDTTGDPAHPSLFSTIGDPDEDEHFTFDRQQG